MTGAAAGPACRAATSCLSLPSRLPRSTAEAKVQISLLLRQFCCRQYSDASNCCLKLAKTEGPPAARNEQIDWLLQGRLAEEGR